MALQVNKILETTTVVAGASFVDTISGGAFQAIVTGTGALTASISIQASLNNVHWIEIATMSLSGTTSATDGFVNLGEWLYYRAECTALTGTGATVTVLMTAQS